MIVRKPKQSSPYLSTPPPEDYTHCSTAFSDCDADDEETMSMEESTPSRPLSETLSHGDPIPVGPYCPQRPTLHDVLTNSAPPPWTLSAFTAYLSQNHCLETLEFTMDSKRYRKKYDSIAGQMAGMPITSNLDSCRQLRMLWRRLMDAYIIPDAPREVNLPSNIRDTLLSIANHTSPPRPEALDSAVRIIYELMDESVLIPFLNAVSSSRGASTYSEIWYDTDENLDMQGTCDERSLHRNRSRRRPSPATSAMDSTTSASDPRTRLSHSSSLTTGISRGRLTAHASNNSTGSGDATLTDDSESASSPGKEPMTPPNTPPSSDIGGSSPRNRNDNTWKKMMGKLGTKKKSSVGMRRINDEVDY